MVHVTIYNEYRASNPLIQSDQEINHLTRFLGIKSYLK